MLNECQMRARNCTCAVGGDGNLEEIDFCVEKDPQIHAHVGTVKKPDHRLTTQITARKCCFIAMPLHVFP